MLKKFLSLLMCILFLPLVVNAAITFNSWSENTEGATDTNSFAHTVNAGSNRILIVGVAVEHSAATVPSVSSITYDGVGLTQIGTQLYEADRNRTDLWYLLNPNVTTANVVITLSAAPDRASSGGAITINGAKQQGPEVSNSTTGSGTAVSVTITTVTNNAWIIDSAAHNKATSTLTEEGTQTERYETATEQRHAGSTKPFVTAGPTTMSWTISDARPWGIYAAAFEEEGAATYIPKVIIIRGAK